MLYKGSCHCGKVAFEAEGRIDGAMACLQAYGNAEIDCRPIDIGHSWIFLARFIDHERGTSVIRPFLQRKAGGSRLDMQMATASTTSARYAALVEILSRQMHHMRVVVGS